MRIEIAQQTEHPVPQFIVYAETSADRAVLGAFTEYKYTARKPVRFWMHGPTSNHDGVYAFNFGYIFEDNFRKPTVRQRLKQWWLARS